MNETTYRELAQAASRTPGFIPDGTYTTHQAEAELLDILEGKQEFPTRHHADPQRRSR